MSLDDELVHDDERINELMNDKKAYKEASIFMGGMQWITAFLAIYSVTDSILVQAFCLTTYFSTSIFATYFLSKYFDARESLQNIKDYDLKKETFIL